MMTEKKRVERDTKSLSILFVLAAALSLIPFTYLSLSDSSGMSVSAPVSLLAILPAFILPYWLTLLVPSSLFLLWNGYLFKKRETVPVRTSVGFLLLSGLTIVHFIIGWSAGVEYQGISHTKSVCMINIFAIGLLGLLWFLAFKMKRYSTNFIFSWMLFLWLSWQAFPYLGEW